MATVYSVQQAIRNAAAAGTGFALLSAINTAGARVHCTFANYVTGADASGTVIELWTLPKGARILRGAVVTGAMGANVTTSVGTSAALVDDLGATTTAAGVANLLAATATAAASNTNFAATRLLGAGGITTTETKLNLVTGGATTDAGIPVHAWVEYLHNY